MDQRNGEKLDLLVIESDFDSTAVAKSILSNYENQERVKITYSRCLSDVMDSLRKTRFDGVISSNRLLIIPNANGYTRVFSDDAVYVLIDYFKKNKVPVVFIKGGEVSSRLSSTIDTYTIDTSSKYKQGCWLDAYNMLIEKIREGEIK